MPRQKAIEDPIKHSLELMKSERDGLTIKRDAMDLRLKKLDAAIKLLEQASPAE
jgi:hypothetical protein